MAGDWKTIEQRERSTASARRTQRRGQAAVTTGGLLAGGAYLRGAGPQGNLGDYGSNAAVREAKVASRTGRSIARTGSISVKDKLKWAGRIAQSKPLGSALLGGGGLAAVGGAGMLQGAAREGYHQSRINSRRKDNAQRRVTSSKALTPRQQKAIFAGATGGTLAAGTTAGYLHGKKGKRETAPPTGPGLYSWAWQKGKDRRTTTSKAFATRDENSSVGTSITWKAPQGDWRKGKINAKARGQEKSRGVGRHLTRDENSSPGVVHLKPRSPQGKFVSHEADLKVFSPIGRKGKRRIDPPKALDRFTNSGRGQARIGRGTPVGKAAPRALGSMLLDQGRRPGRRLV